mgnify:CR=1 FL=1
MPVAMNLELPLRSYLPGNLGLGINDSLLITTPVLFLAVKLKHCKMN